jgi:hypothetical protein
MRKLSPILAAAALLAVTGCGPSPQAVCDHVFQLAEKELGKDAAAALGTKEECVKDEERRKEMKGIIKYKEKASCAIAAKTLADLDKC